MRSLSTLTNEMSIPRPERERPQADQGGAFVTSRAARSADRSQAFYTVVVSALIFIVAIPFAKVPLGQVWAFIPAYQSALVVCDLVTAALLLGQARFARSAAL